MKADLCTKGEAIINDLGSASKHLIRNSGIREVEFDILISLINQELMRTAKQFAAHETTIASTENMLQQMTLLSENLLLRTEKVEERFYFSKSLLFSSV